MAIKTINVSSENIEPYAGFGIDDFIEKLIELKTKGAAFIYFESSLDDYDITMNATYAREETDEEMKIRQKQIDAQYDVIEALIKWSDTQTVSPFEIASALNKSQIDYYNKSK